MPSDKNETPQAVGKPENSATTEIRTHGMKDVADPVFWGFEIAFLAAAIIGILLIALARGPRRADAVAALAAANKEKT